MRRALLVLLPLLLLGAAQPASAADGRAHAKAKAKAKAKAICAERGYTVDSTPAARLFEVARGGDHTLFGCLRATGRRVALASWFDCSCSVADELGPSAELEGSWFVELSETYSSCGPVPGHEDDCTSSTSYELRNLRSGVEVAPAGPVGQVVPGNGFFAYADGRAVIVRGGRERVVDPGPGVVAGSLAVAGKRLYWLRGGLPRTSP